MRAYAALPRSTPAAQGVAAGGIAAFLDALAARALEVHSFMLLRHGQIVAEGWWQPYAPGLRHELYSLSKSFTSTAVGAAIHEGRLTLDDTVVSFFPEERPATISANLAAMCVRHLLTMGTGHAEDTSARMHEGRGDWVRDFFDCEVAHAPGSTFLYNSGATYMLSAIVQRVTGQTLVEYLTPRLFEPLGIEGPPWACSPQGINVGGWGLSVTTEDIARFGLLYLRGGRWGDRQLVPSAWVRDATSKHISNGNGGASDWQQGYGYQFWRCRHGSYRGDGAYGQFCIVMPEQDAVLAMTGGTDNLQGVLDQVWEHILPALEGPDASDQSALDRRLGQLSLAVTAGTGRPGTLARAGHFTLQPNAARIEKLALEFDDQVCRVVLMEAGQERTITCGFGQWLPGRALGPRGRDPLPCAGHAAWSGDGALLLQWSWVTTPFGATLRVSPSGDGVTLHYRSNVGQHARGIVLRGA